MFWKFIRWCGSLIVMLLVLAATLLVHHPEEIATPVQPVDAETQPSKNFNL